MKLNMNNKVYTKPTSLCIGDPQAAKTPGLSDGALVTGLYYIAFV